MQHACSELLSSRLLQLTKGCEADLRKQAISAFKHNPSIRVRPLPCYIHGFEAAIVLDVDLSPGNQTVVNIEIDGPTHFQHRSCRLCGIRDAFYRSRGVRVFSMGPYEAWVLVVCFCCVAQGSLRIQFHY